MEELYFDLASLQLNDFPAAKLKVDHLFAEWLIQEGEGLVRDIEEMLSNHLQTHFDSTSTHQSKTSAVVTSCGPPRSPTKKSQSPNKKRPHAEFDEHDRLNAQHIITDTSPEETADTHNPSESNTTLASAAKMTAPRRRSNFDSIPAFYIPGERRRRSSQVSSDDELLKRLPEIEASFKPYKDGMPVEKFVHVTKRLCGIPSFFNLPLCKRISELYMSDGDSIGDSLSSSSSGSSLGSSRGGLGVSVPKSSGGRTLSGLKVNISTFLKFWKAEVEPYDRVERFFRVIKRPDSDFIYKDDLVPFIQELLRFHPGLDFLESHEEFQRKYALTVITRIFYKVNTSRTGKLSLKEVRKSNLLQEFMHVDEETDINRVAEYFSYEHFYVLYCRFFELDTDKDSKICREDLMKYGDHALSEAIVDRLFQVGIRVFSDGREGGFSDAGGMQYPDFIYFMLAEEDKNCEGALRYWFSCCDLDGDGRLTPDEMRYFYKVQLHRVTNLGQESIQFQDVLCQMIDLINPVDSESITIEDLIRHDKIGVSGTLFDVLFNLHKFLRFETRDPFQEKLKRDDGFASDWDRYAHHEYHRLAAEEEGYDTADGNMEVDSLLMDA